MSLPDPLLVDKPYGMSPLGALQALRELHPELATTKLAYAGRLDPMASGLLLVLRDGQLGRQEEYWNLPKQYDATILLGLTTDSYDVLGLAATGGIPPDERRILTAVAGLAGKTLLSVPVFSSPSVGGKPLFAWAHEGVPDSIAVPVRTMRVSEVRVTDITATTLGETASRAALGVARVNGAFRQDAILRRWAELAHAEASRPLTAVRLTIACGSGTYIRSLAHELGRRLRCGGMLSALRRTHVGTWSVADAKVIRPA